LTIVGLEARCRARFGGKSSEGLARLEDKDLYFRGDFRLKVPLAEVKTAEASKGILRVDAKTGALALELGPDAEKWALKIRYPRGLMDKLGVKPGTRVSVVGLDEPWFWRELEARGADLSRGRLRPGSDLVFAGMSARADLARLEDLREAITPAGAVWVIWPKGRKEFREDDVRAAGPAAGLVDVKVVSVSERLSGLKMMIPVAQRPAPPR
jgi:hypothetical protein